MSVFGRLLCALPRKFGGGHKRGKFVRIEGMTAIVGEGLPMPRIVGEANVYACPRCGHETRYKIGPRAPALAHKP